MIKFILAMQLMFFTCIGMIGRMALDTYIEYRCSEAEIVTTVTLFTSMSFQQLGELKI